MIDTLLWSIYSLIRIPNVHCLVADDRLVWTNMGFSNEDHTLIKKLACFWRLWSTYYSWKNFCSAGASLHEVPRTTTIGPQFSSDFFSLVVALNNNRHTYARAQKIFTLPNMRPLCIREPPPPTGGYGGSFRWICPHIQMSAWFSHWKRFNLI